VDNFVDNYLPLASCTGSDLIDNNFLSRAVKNKLFKINHLRRNIFIWNRYIDMNDSHKKISDACA